ncbi:MAG: hypothetical protein EOO56_23200 [Hymenobacter sp.]|nr:MAG: hypothetical protein EOO56_23200 [Hymenobacter sp.]
MNPRDIPEVVAELIYEMHEVRSELKGLNGRVDRLEQTMARVVEEMHGMREEMQALPEQIGAAIFKSLAPFLDKIMNDSDRVKDHESRLNRFENPQA